MRFFATAAKGTEPALRDELRELRMPGVRADRGGVHFEGGWLDAARACMGSRIAVRVLFEVADFPARDEAALYAGTRDVAWEQWLTPRTTLAVRATTRASRLTHSQFVAQKTKDAVVDALRDRLGARPSVDRDDPDVAIAVRLARDHATLYLDMGGSSLHERGWRTRTGEAPLRETLAAAVLRLSGWDRRTPLVDPMCGSGTIAIEAALWSRQVAPGLGRARFGFERWASHDDEQRRQTRDLRDRARAAVGSDGPPILGTDVDPEVLDGARDNARDAGAALTFARADVRALAPFTEPTAVVTNPPYGERLDASAGFYEDLGRALRACHAERIALLAGTPAIGRAMGRDADKYWVLYNGPIECRLLLYAAQLR